jgi:hypothetical protein
VIVTVAVLFMVAPLTTEQGDLHDQRKSHSAILWKAFVACSSHVTVPFRQRPERYGKSTLSAGAT